MAIESEENHRAKEGVAVCLRDLGDGRSRLIFDDVVADDPSERAPVWRHKAFFTHNAYANHQLDNMQLTDQQFQEIGQAIVARLLAINHRVA
jgi:hypothetical protein